MKSANGSPPRTKKLFTIRICKFNSATVGYVILRLTSNPSSFPNYSIEIAISDLLLSGKYWSGSCTSGTFIFDSVIPISIFYCGF